jgi:cyclic dehypoxanthinyl futalosine synthase
VVQTVKGKREALKRISTEEALALYHRDDLFELGERAQEVRFALNPRPVVTYNVNRNINYTNVCNAGCKFCAFYRLEGHDEAYVITREEITQKIDELIAAGGTEVLLQGGHNRDLPLQYYTDLFRFIKERWPEVTLHALSAPEIFFIAENVEKTSVEAVLKELIAAGLDSLPGGGAEILVDRVRKKMVAAKCMSDEWLNVHRIANRLGIKGTATMMLGHIETIEDRIEHMDRVRQLQDETRGFRAFIGWTFQPENSFWQGKVKPGKGSHEFLKTMALARIFLDNVQHIQASYVTQTLKVAQVQLHFGADDMGGTMLEENVVRLAGADHCRGNEEEVRQAIRSAGFAPIRRNTAYEILEPLPEAQPPQPPPAPPC